MITCKIENPLENQTTNPAGRTSQSGTGSKLVLDFDFISEFIFDEHSFSISQCGLRRVALCPGMRLGSKTHTPNAYQDIERLRTEIDTGRYGDSNAVPHGANAVNK